MKYSADEIHRMRAALYSLIEKTRFRSSLGETIDLGYIRQKTENSRLEDLLRTYMNNETTAEELEAWVDSKLKEEWPTF